MLTWLTTKIKNNFYAKSDCHVYDLLRLLLLLLLYIKNQLNKGFTLGSKFLNQSRPWPHP